MKLIFCTKCHDIFRLQMMDRRCTCQKSGGFYQEDGLNAVVYGPCKAVGFANSSFNSALYAAKPGKRDSPRFEAFVISEPCDTIARRK